MGSDGFNRILTGILTGFYLLDPARVRPVPSKTHDFKGFRPDFNRIPWNLVKIWLKLLDPLLGRPHLSGADKNCLAASVASRH